MRRCPPLRLLAAALLLPALAHADAVTVREPAYGLPHIFADTDLELARENGREIAKDRLGQLILLARAGRGTLAQLFGILDDDFYDDDLQARREGYSSSELNAMWEKLPERDRLLILEYCKGVNDTIEAIYAGTLPEPLEVTVIDIPFQLRHDLFGNATQTSDQLDPFYLPPGGADPERPNAGFQFTPEMAMSVAVLQVRNFGLAGFNEASREAQLDKLVDQHGDVAGAQIWSDLNFVNDPLAPVSVPDARTPGFGGPLAEASPPPSVQLVRRFPQRAYDRAWQTLQDRREARAERARRLGAWPQLGSYSWAISSARSATGHPWLGGFPQTGELTPSIMHFTENRSRQRISAIGMEFVGGPFVLIGHTDSMAWTSTTAQLPVVDTFFERIVNEDADALGYLDEGTPAPLARRTETAPGLAARSTVVWRSHERGGNGGSRPVLDFVGDAEGTAESGTDTTLVASGAFGSGFVGGHVALVDGTGAGQIRAISAASDDTLTVGSPWTTAPDATTRYVAALPGTEIIAVATDSAAWLEESTAALGFSLLQQGEDVLDVRAAMRIIPSTHNFPSADNRTFNGHGTAAPFGNIAYYSSGYSRVRQGGEDPRRPLDGSLPNPLVRLSGSVENATETTLSATGAFAGVDLSPPGVNARYLEPDLDITEFIVLITSGEGYKQTRRIASNTNDTITLEFPWGVTPSPGDTWEIQEIVGMPEAINPAEGYTANWNNKAATGDPGSGFGRQHRVVFIHERLAADAAWDRVKNRMLNSDLAGLDGDGRFGRFLVPRLRQAVDAVGADPDVLDALAALEAYEAAPTFGRRFVDPVDDVLEDDRRPVAGETLLLESVLSRLASDIYADELASVGVPGGSRGLALVQHAVDSAAGDLVGAYAQAYAGDYFNGVGWETQLRDSFATVVDEQKGIPADGSLRANRFIHPLAALPGKEEDLAYAPIPTGNRGTWEQIVEVGPELRGEFIFPLGQSAHVEGQFAGPLSFSDPNVDSLHPIWRDWRFLPMLPVSTDIARAGTADSDGDGVLDGFERWYFGTTAPLPTSDEDADGLDLAGEFAAGSDPTDADTDRDGVPDGSDEAPQDRLVPVPEPGALALGLAALAGVISAWRYAPRWSSKPGSHA